MTIELLAPAFLAVLAGAVGGWLRRRLPPRAAVVILTVLAVASAAAVVWALVMVVIGGLLGVPDVLAQLRFCRRVLQAGHEAPAAVGGLSAALLAVGVARCITFEVRWRRTIGSDASADVDGVALVDTEEPVAFSVPGRRSRVVVSRGLLEMLAPLEQAALFAHENCHLSRRHHRYLHAAGLAAAAVPVLGRLVRHVRFATEREADEAAVDAVGDRRVVARAIAAAVTGVPLRQPALGAGDHAVTERLEELLHPPTAAWLPAATILAGLSASFVVLFGSTLQLHHLVTFGAHVCGLD